MEPKTFLKENKYDPKDLKGKVFNGFIAGQIGGMNSGNIYYRNSEGVITWIDHSHYLMNQLVQAKFLDSFAFGDYRIEMEKFVWPVFIKLGEPCQVRKISKNLREISIDMPDAEFLAIKESGKMRVIENRNAQIKKIDELRGTLQKIFRVRIHTMDNSALIKIANELNTKVFLPDSEVGPNEKSEYAKTLNLIFHTLDERIKEAADRQKTPCPKIE